MGRGAPFEAARGNGTDASILWEPGRRHNGSDYQDTGQARIDFFALTRRFRFVVAGYRLSFPTASMVW